MQVIEGVHRETLKNHSLKIVGRGGRAKLRVVKALDAMQVFELISSFVDEVYFHPNYVCICFKWGTHEVDSSQQLTAWIVDALHLLRELLPPKQHAHLRLDVQDVQRLLLATNDVSRLLPPAESLHPIKHAMRRRSGSEAPTKAGGTGQA